MPTFIDLTQQTFHKLTVIKRVGTRSHSPLWLCKCECGNTATVTTRCLRRGDTSSCGCNRIIDLTGQTFSRLRVIEPVGRDKRGNVRWRCTCKCGNETSVSGTELLRTGTQSCGCLFIEATAAKGRANLKHGHSSKGGTAKASPTYRLWASMIQRCTNCKSRCYKNYGGKGVTVCSRWRGERGFQNFLKDKGIRPEGTTLGRYADMGFYSPENTSWQTWEEQGAERHKKHLLKKVFEQFKKAA